MQRSGTSRTCRVVSVLSRTIITAIVCWFVSVFAFTTLREWLMPGVPDDGPVPFADFTTFASWYNSSDISLWHDWYFTVCAVAAWIAPISTGVFLVAQILYPIASNGFLGCLVGGLCILRIAASIPLRTPLNEFVPHNLIHYILMMVFGSLLALLGLVIYIACRVDKKDPVAFPILIKND